MSVVTARNEFGKPAHPAPGEWTVDDLAQLPDDGRRYELFDGELVVSPAPFPLHQWSVAAFYRLLFEACPTELIVLFSPIDFQPTKKRSFEPDLLVARRADVQPKAVLTAPPLLTVEVISRSSRKIDRERKWEMYATSGVDNYWIFDPEEPDFVAYRRDGQKYIEVGAAKDTERFAVERPFPVEICPAEIAAG
jgi:Uma2 family endonuclease